MTTSPPATDDDYIKDAYALATAYVRCDWEAVDLIRDNCDSHDVIGHLLFAYCSKTRLLVAHHQATVTADAIIAEIQADRADALNYHQHGEDTAS